MLEALLSVIDRLIQLKEYRNRRFRLVFKEIVEPAFNDLLRVHGDYIRMFQETLALLPDASTDRGAEYNQRVRSALEYLEDKRTEFEPVRDKLRTLAATLSRADLDQDVTAFVGALILYFPSACVPKAESASQDLHGRLRYWDESSLTSASELATQEDSQQAIRRFIPLLIDEHRKHWSRVCEHYASLQIRATDAG